MVDFNRLALAPCIAAFGETAIYQPEASAPVTLVGIFNKLATEDKISGSGEIVQVVAPTFAINIADLPQGLPLPSRNALIEVGGTLWQIAEPVQDNFGQLVLKLKRLAP